MSCITRFIYQFDVGLWQSLHPIGRRQKQENFTKSDCNLIWIHNVVSLATTHHHSNQPKRLASEKLKKTHHSSSSSFQPRYTTRPSCVVCYGRCYLARLRHFGSS